MRGCGAEWYAISSGMAIHPSLKKHLKVIAIGTGALMTGVSHLLLLPSPFEAIDPSKGENAAQGQEGTPH